jgi:hypothetical protein
MPRRLWYGCRTGRSYVQPLHHPVAVTLSCARVGVASPTATITAKTANLFIALLLMEAQRNQMNPFTRCARSYPPKG